MTLRRRSAVAVVVAAVGLLLAGIGLLAVAAPAQPAAAEATPSTLGGGTLSDLHAAGYTGENVSIGVLSVTGFDRSRSGLTDQVAGARAFGPGATVAQGGHNRHGTAAATVAAETAPEADVYLATFETQAGYQRAVQWLLRNDVDVVVAPVSFYGTPADGSSQVSRVASDAVRQDAVVVAAAGNLAESQWRGRYDAVSGGRLAYANGSTRNYLRGEGGHVTLWLSWERARADEQYTVSLYRAPAGDGDDTELVARSRNFTADAIPNQRLEADVAGGRYFAVVRGPDRPTGTRLRLTSPTHSLGHSTARSSLAAPAAAEGVLAVGAYDTGRSRVEPFSSRGPTPDGRRGIDVVAPARHDVLAGDEPYVGTSAAAPYAGGVAALLRQADPDASPETVEHALEATAVDVGRPGPDLRAGYGLVDPYRAVAGLENASR